MTLIAKPVIKDQYWILTDGVEKVGNVIADDNGYEVKLNGSKHHYSDTSELINTVNIQFDDLPATTKKNKLFHDYPVSGKMYNSILDIKRNLQLYTKTPDSTSYYVAGYFAININDEWQTIFCPKYIFIQRYNYMGPFVTNDEADNSIS